MDYQTYEPHPDLKSLVKHYWTLEVPVNMANKRQRIIPDGCMDMIFTLGDDIKRYVSESETVAQPRTMILGQITKPFYIKPTGYVNTFAVRFYPYGLANFVSTPMGDLTNKETALSLLFGKKVSEELEKSISEAKDTPTRITVIETFLFKMLNNQTSIDNIVKTTLDILFLERGNGSIKAALKNDSAKRRQLERKFVKQVGMSPKQLGKVIRLQSALKAMLESKPESLAKVAYGSDYYDQAHFTRDFKELTGTTPKDFFDDEGSAVAALFYKH